MTENMKAWLRILYEEAIENHKVAASNERLWSLGSNTDEQAVMHMENAKEHWEFIDILNEMIAEI